jgi:hypothetical protein
LEFSYVDIADTRGPFIFFHPPVINNLGQLASVGQQGFGSGQGLLFRGQGGALEPIGDDRKLGTSIDSFAMNDSGAVAFESYFGNPGLYVSSGGPPLTIANSASGFSSFGKPAINNGGLVAAPAVGGPGGQSIVAGTGGSPSTLADTSGNLSSFTFVTFDMNAAGAAVFIANTTRGTQQGVFVADAGGLHAIADTQGGWSAPFSSVAINEMGSVAFIGQRAGTGAGVYLYMPASGITPVLTSVQENLHFNQASINNQGDIALFGGLYDPVSGTLDGAVILQHRGGKDVVIETGDPLFGSTVTRLLVDGRYLNDHDQVAFYYELADGRIGVARADPVPEPGAAMMVLAGLAMLIGWRWYAARATPARADRAGAGGVTTGCSSPSLRVAI